MSELEVVNREAVGREAWDAFVDASEDAWLWHRFDLCAALSHWASSRDASFALRADGRLVALMPLRVVAYRRWRVFDVCDLESLGGPAVAPDAGRRLAERARSQAIDEARRRAPQPPMELRMTLPPLAPALRGEEAPRVNPLLALGLENTLTQTWTVDLRAGADALWESLQGRARTAVRKAQREGVTVRVAHPDDADLDRYEALHAATYARTGAQRHPRAYFAAIWRDFLPNGLAQVFMAERDGQVIAARNFGVYKGAALTWTAAGEDTAGPLGANALLQWEAMRIFAGAGLEWLETGEAFPGAADEKQRGLSAFKASFGGELRPLYRGRLDLRAPWQRRLDALRG